jgi:hypothetical protein
MQVVQDTGSGGSYPVSTDRVVWALGARRVLDELDGAERVAFSRLAHEALRHTVEHDRDVVYDVDDGLYRGEQSFLDWREQSYPDFTANDVVPIAMGKALSTNLLHVSALELVRDLALEHGDAVDADRFADQALALRGAIHDQFYVAEDGLFSAFIQTPLDTAPVRRYDLLGQALAVLTGVASSVEAQTILERYPHYGPGAPVIWPQQQDTPIYHNRAEWPFVTSYWLRAAKSANHDAVGAKMVRALMRGSALHLSNMENFEAGTGAAFVSEGPSSGPVVNSRRQLWSVAGYLSMVQHTLFGLEASDDGLRVDPWVPAGLVNDVVAGRDGDAFLAGSDALVLNDFPHRGRRVTVVLHLPVASADRGVAGTLVVRERRLNGVVVAGAVIADALMEATNRIDVDLGPAVGQLRPFTQVSDADYQQVFSPRTPSAPSLQLSNGRVVVGLDPGRENRADIRFRVLRDGAVIADDLAGSATNFTDSSHQTSSARSPCYVIETTFVRSGTHSQHSAPSCFWGESFQRISTFGAAVLDHRGGVGSTAYGLFHYEPWGDVGDTLSLPSFTASQTGPHLVQLTFGNGAGDISTGVTAGVKRIIITDEVGATVGRGIVVMPHLGTWDRFEDSSFVSAELVAGHRYRIDVIGDDDAVNMSSFAHFQRYTGGLGGGAGVFNRVNIAEVKVLAR